MSQVDEPKYQVIENKKPIEVRQYQGFLVAEVETSGPRTEAISDGFKKLATYIFKDNSAQEKMSMTAPVLQKKSEDANSWKTSFVMPAIYSMKTLPMPLDGSIQINEVLPKKFAVIQFSGPATDANIHKNLELLNEFIDAHKIPTMGKPIYAFYNPPWTLPFLRRNEIMLEIQP